MKAELTGKNGKIQTRFQFSKEEFEKFKYLADTKIFKEVYQLEKESSRYIYFLADGDWINNEIKKESEN